MLCWFQAYSKVKSLCIYVCVYVYAALCLVAQSCLTLCNPMDCSLPGSSVHGDSPGKNTGIGCHALLQGIFPTEGLNPHLPHCRGFFYLLSHKGSPRLLEWVAYPFSKGSSQPRNWTRVSWIAGGFCTSWATREAHFARLSFIIHHYKLLNRVSCTPQLIFVGCLFYVNWCVC